VAKRRLALLWIVPLIVLATSRLGLAQGNSNSSISGTVVDSGGGAIPGASVIIKGESGEQFEAVTNAEGVFNVPGIGAGIYKATVTLTGFKTVEVEVRVLPNTPASFKATLEVGALTETVIVSSSSELINTQTATVASTLNADQLNRMPTPTRNALNAVTFLPGINTADTNRESRINGLPESFVQITLDGVSNNDQYLRTTDSFFASITPRQDAVEAVSVVTAAGGANVGGSGAVSVNFQTRSGTNKFSGTAYEYVRDPSLNTNNWLNERNGLPKNDVKLYQPGARVGGPMVIPGLFDGRGKAFFMVHYEQVRFPNSFSRTRTILNPAALNGVFRYDVGGQTREVNVLDLARTNGQASAIDSTVMSVLQRIQASTRTTGTVEQQSDPLLMNYRWQSPGKLFEHQPTVRVDFNLGDKHRLSGTYAIIWSDRDPDYLNGADARFPGAPVYRLFSRQQPFYRAGLRSTLTRNLVSELSAGFTAFGGTSAFGSQISNGAQNFADQNGYAIDFDANIGLTNWHTESSYSWRTAPAMNIDESLTWQLGKHSLNFGGGFLHTRVHDNAQTVVPGINLGFNTTNDPAAGLFTTANFPGASGANLTDARELYALLTGRVSAVTGQAALDSKTNRYTAFAPRRREGYINMYSAFMQDSWRTTPTLTINAGLRWDLQMPFTAMNDTLSAANFASVCGMSGLGDGGTYSRCNFNRPGPASNGVVPEYVQFSSGTRGYDIDWNNVSPNVGIAWRPNVQSGFLRPILGDPEQATLRAGYSVAYDRQGMDQFTGLYGANPGATLSLTRDESTGIVAPGESWPVFLNQSNRLFNAPFAETPTYPIAVRANRADNMSAFAPDIKIGMAQTWTVSFQRALGKDMAVDVRYVGTRGSSQWSTINYNTRQIEGNGFIQEFQLAVQNLRANNLSGVANRRGSFAYFGAGTGTSPLPIYLAYLNGSRDAGNPAAYAGGTQTWTNTAITQDLVHVWPDPNSSVTDLDGNLTRRNNALNAGLPANFFVVNPAINTLNVTDSGAYSDYHALQIDLRRRLSKGLSASANYQYALERGSAFLNFKYGREMRDQPNVRHAIKTQWDWTLPVGRGQRFGANMHPILDGVIGGWSVNSVGRVQARVVDFGNFRLVGMSKKDVQDMFKHDIRINPANGLPTVYMMPDDVILNTRRAFSIDPASVTGYGELGVPEGRYFAPANSENCTQLKVGDCAPSTLIIRMPWFTRFDLGVTKKFPIHGATNIEVRFDVLNLFDNINFDPVNAPGSGAGIFSTTGFYDDPSNTYDPGGRIGSVMLRINW
jgi:hypothetical protein